MNSKQQPKKTDIKSICGNEKGLALITSLMLVALLTIVGTISVNTTNTDIMISSNHRDSVRVFYAAEGGAEYGLNQLRQTFSTVLNPGTTEFTAIENNFYVDVVGTGTALGGYTFGAGTFTVARTSASTTLAPITSGNYQGLSAITERYDITTQAGTGTASAKVVVTAEDYLIPLFQFAVFYEEDLEFHPGPDMTFDLGWIHSNSDIYLGSENTLTIDSKTTSAGDILYSRKTTGNEQNVNGVVEFNDGSNAQAMKQDDDLDGSLETSEILDSTRSDWVVESQNRWNGEVKSGEHGINTIDLVPMSTGTDEIELIKEGDTFDPILSSESTELQQTRYYWKAGLRILDDQAYDQAGGSVDLTDGGNLTNPISHETFWDAREGKHINVTTVDMDLLRTNYVATAELTNGILYVSESDLNSGVRLVNGGTIPSGGFTVASENPIYIQGDYNTANEPAAVLGDAVTILSNDWDDSNDLSYSARNAVTTTTINTAIVSGNVESTGPTAGGEYSGGLENLPRFLENWAGTELQYSGSVVCLFESEKATEQWGKSNVYSPPDRIWSYGMDVNNMPPGTPFVRVVSKVGWYHDIN